jgi:ArsR family transcriptional regulator, arsenate/arsenite/antimonite-responsive transcriptional repressor / arsenate reductase (thioredoxin)
VETRPPVLFQLAGHPIRWRLLAELAASDRRVRELTGVLGRPQNLVSYHLRLLRSGGLVAAHRSSFDGRDSYYGLDLERYGELFAATGAFGSAEVPPTRPLRMLFLCTGNSSRSQIAEALAERLSHGAVRAWSAGSRPKTLHPNAVRVMAARGIDISHNETKSLDLFADERFDYVISLCDKVREVCPEFPDTPLALHWSVPDPALAPGTDDETYAVFERTAVDLEARITFLLHRLMIGIGGADRGKE